MTSQIIAWVGVLLGAVTSFFATSMVERAKFRQTLATRWDDRKLDAYIEYSACVKDANRAAKQLLDAHERGADTTEPLAAMEAAEARRSIAFEGLVLLTDQASTEAAAHVNERLWALLKCASAPADFSPTDRQAASPAVIHALNKLHDTARADLAISTRER
ncbi:hypothetical protein [Streptomyces sp. NPDC048172]|uniref:hypothetical protein n=1 Tax=Streptomyces sp. NPDC048172 TaxID=3365505 RepID=UPI00371F5EC7